MKENHKIELDKMQLGANHFMSKSQLLLPNHKLPRAHYVIHSGLRFIKPYLKHRKTFAKERWLNKDILSAYTFEFSVPDQVCLDMLNNGHILINDQKVDPSYVIRPQDVLSTRDMIVEKPVLHFDSIRLLPNLKPGADLVHFSFFAIQKPHGIPIHAVSKFIRNSLSAILQDEYNLKTRFVHRLDKCTSGVLICGTSTDAVRLYHDMSTKNLVSKYYLARVNGRFPNVVSLDSEQQPAVHHIQYPLVMISQRRGLWDPIVNGQIVQSVVNRDTTDKEPVDAYTQAVGLHYCPTTNQSIVVCKPITGRTHQIRCHLRGMGHAIVGDDRIPETSSIMDWTRKYAIMTEHADDEQKCSQVSLQYFTITFVFAVLTFHLNVRRCLILLCRNFLRMRIRYLRNSRLTFIPFDMNQKHSYLRPKTIQIIFRRHFQAMLNLKQH